MWGKGLRMRPVARYVVVILAFLAGIVGGVQSASASPGEPPAPAADPSLVRMTLGVVLRALDALDVGRGSYDAELDVTVSCDAEPCRPDLDVANGTVVSRLTLKDEPLRKQVRLRAQLAAPLDLADYPFDSHLLPVVLRDRGDPQHVRFALDEAATGFGKDVTLPGWRLDRWRAAPTQDEAGVAGLRFEVQASRPARVALLRACVPLLVLLLVTALTLLLGPKSATARLVVATGGLLSLVVLHAEQAASLPPHAQLTRFDELMVAGYVVSLANVAFSALMVRFAERKNERMGDLMYLAAAGAVPGLLLLTWTAVLTQLV